MNAKPDMSTLLQILPAQVIAAGIIKAAGKFAAETPEFAERILFNSWLKVAPLLRDALSQNPTGDLAASALVIESYFVHRGDWKSMEREMADCSPMDERVTAIIIDAISSGLNSAKERVK